MNTLLDNYLQLVNTFSRSTLLITIVVSKYIKDALIFREDQHQYILCNEQMIDLIRREFSLPNNVLGLSILSGIPVVYDDELAIRLLMKARLAVSERNPNAQT